MKRAIITGADGFVGAAAVEEFLSQGVEVLALDLAEQPRRLRPRPGLDYRACDVADTAALQAAVTRGGGRYDAFVHLAWAGSAGVKRTDYALQLQNARQAVACLQTAKALGCTRFLGAGSIMEYEAEAALQVPGHRLGGGYIYGMGKRAAHGMCQAVAADVGIELVWPMITNAYGVGERSSRLVYTTLCRMLRGEALRFTAATQRYDFVYITDVARALYRIARWGQPFCAYVIGSGSPRPLREFIREMQRVCAPGAELRFGELPFTGVDLPARRFATDDTQRDCGFTPAVAFEEGIRRTMEWLKKEGAHGAEL